MFLELQSSRESLSECLLGSFLTGSLVSTNLRPLAGKQAKLHPALGLMLRETCDGPVAGLKAFKPSYLCHDGDAIISPILWTEN